MLTEEEMNQEEQENEIRVSVEGAMGFSHSVPESKLAEFREEQKRLEESGELEEVLKTMNEKLLTKKLFPDM